MTTQTKINTNISEEDLKKLVSEQCVEIDWLKERIAWFERQVFGQRSERVINPSEDMNLYFPGFEPTSSEEGDPEKGKLKPPEKKRKRKPKNDNSNGLVIPDNLPVEQTVLDLPEEEKICPETGKALIQIGEEVTRKLAFKPGSYFVKEILRPKYALPSKEGIAIRELPESIFPRTRVDESMLAEIITRKFADHLPLYRLSEIFSRDGVQISRQLLSQWIIRTGTTLKPLYDLLTLQIKASKNVFCDETPIKLQVKGKGKLQQAYMWVLAGGNENDPPDRVYTFYENRKHQNAYDLLENFQGVLHSDKYGAYQTLAKIIGVLWQPCWSHIRRKFEEAQSGDSEFRDMFLRKVRHLFMLERVAWSRSPEERLRIRKGKEEPIIDALIKATKEKLLEGTVLPKSKFGIALNYFYGMIDYVKTYIEHPYAHLDNNVAERTFRTLAIGRKNWLFVGSLQGGEATAILLSLVQTCRARGINPREYLEDVLRRFQSHPYNRLSELLPKEWAAAQQQPPPERKPLHIR